MSLKATEESFVDLIRIEKQKVKMQKTRNDILMEADLRARISIILESLEKHDVLPSAVLESMRITLQGSVRKTINNLIDSVSMASTDNEITVKNTIIATVKSTLESMSDIYRKGKDDEYVVDNRY